MLPSQLFQSAANQLCTAWNTQGNNTYKWEWVTSKSVFAETLGGGYLAMCNIPVPASVIIQFISMITTLCTCHHIVSQHCSSLVVIKMASC
ncbi:hypothetical protein WJX79_004599 [Trebouxia sp. C0005]